MTPKESRNLEFERIERIVARAPHQADALTLAHRVQVALGYVPTRAVELVAAIKGIEVERLESEIGNDDRLLSAPPGRHRVLICTGRTCARRGGARLLRQARKQLGIGVFESTEDESVRLEPFRCFGQCAQAPNVRLSGSLRGAMTEKRFGLLLNLFMKKDV